MVPQQSDWPQVRLGEIAEVSAGQSAPQGPEYFGGEHRFIRVSHIDVHSHAVTGFDLITDEAVRKGRLRLFPRGSVLMPKSGASVRLEKRAMLPFDAYVVSHLAALIPNDEVLDGDYLYCVLRTKRFAEGKAEGYPTLKISEIRDALIPLPPVEEQRKIAHVLRSLRRGKEQTEQVIAAMGELRRSFLRDRFESSAWKMSLLGDVLDGSGGSIQTGPFGSLLHADSYVSDGVPFIMPADMTPNGRVDHGSVKRVTLEDHERLKRYQLSGGDVVVGRRGEIGRRALITMDDVPSLCGSGSLRIRPGETLDPRFLVALFELRPVREFLVSQAVGSTMLNLNSKVLSALPIPLPPIRTQLEIADQLDTMAWKIATEELRRAALDVLFRTLLHELMSGTRRLTNGLKVA